MYIPTDRTFRPRRPPARIRNLSLLYDDPIVKQAAIFHILRPLKRKFRLRQLDLQVLIMLVAYYKLHNADYVTAYQLHRWISGTYRQSGVLLGIRRLREEGYLWEEVVTHAHQVSRVYRLTQRGVEVVNAIYDLYFARLREFLETDGST